MDPLARPYPLPSLIEAAGLLARALILGSRSRRGYLTLLAGLRASAALVVLVRFAVPGPQSQAGLALTVAAVYCVAAGAVLLVAARAGERLDQPNLHHVLIAGDTLLISFFVTQAGDPKTDLYLLYLLPLVAAANYLTRMHASLVAVLVVATYGACLAPLLADASTRLEFWSSWVPRSAFLLVSVTLYRLQRRLPTPDETGSVAPAEARQKLERLLADLQHSIPFQTASIQVLYHNHLQIVACQGWSDPRPIYQIDFPADDRRYPNADVIATRSWVIVDTRQYPHFQDDLYQAAHIRTWMGVPLISPITGETLGLVSLDACAPGAYRPWHARLATLLARNIALTLLEAQLGPAALTQAAKREMVRTTVKQLSQSLARMRLEDKDDRVLAREFVRMGAEIFSVEDCSVYFVHKKDDGSQPAVLHLVASSAIPPDEFANHESPISGKPKKGLTGSAVFRDKTVNLSATEIQRSAFHANVYDMHLRHLRSGRSRQVIIVPLRSSTGQPVGALKLENKVGFTSDNRFPYHEEKLIETFAHVVSLTLDSVRRQHYVMRQRRSIHNVRSILSAGLIQPINSAVVTGGASPAALNEWAHGVRYVASVLDSLLLDVADTPVLESLGVMSALRAVVAALEQGLPANQALFQRIAFQPSTVRDNLPAATREAFFNVGREALLNVIQHADLLGAPGRRARVRFSADRGQYILEIDDNGCGFDRQAAEQNRAHFGLPDMQKQVDNINRGGEGLAALSIDSQPGRGTLVRLACSMEIPVHMPVIPTPPRRRRGDSLAAGIALPGQARPDAKGGEHESQPIA